MLVTDGCHFATEEKSLINDQIQMLKSKSFNCEIINIQDLFGVAAVRNRKRVELVVELVEWSDDAAYDRLGIDTKTMTLADVEVDQLSLPVRPGRSLSLVIEVAARNRLLQERGTHSAMEFVRRIDENLRPAEDPLLDLSMPGADDENE